MGAPRVRCGTGRSGRRPRRPRIATTPAHQQATRRNKQRQPSAAAEDRNVDCFAVVWESRLPQRPPSAAVEDRNTKDGGDADGIMAAAAVRGGRGSQHSRNTARQRG